MKAETNQAAKKRFFAPDKARLLPLTLTGFIIAADQTVKMFIARNWPQHPNYNIKDVFGNDFLRIFHVRNPDIAFSLGRSLPEGIKPVLFIILPVAVLGFLLWYYLTSDEFGAAQRWAIAGIVGGGVGNIIDRVFRPDGVVDFISVKFYGLFGFERWPTFNIADSSVVVCCIILFLTIFFGSPKQKEKNAA